MSAMRKEIFRKMKKIFIVFLTLSALSLVLLGRELLAYINDIFPRG